MLRRIVGDLDLLRHGVATCDRCIARVELRVVDTLALRLVAALEAVACKPIVAVAGFSGRAVGVVPAFLP